jgi:hypothetical protein
MGWKALKEKFGIKHSVQVTSEGVCIGSAYVHNLVTIDPRTGKVQENPTFGDFLRKSYPALLEAAPEEILALVDAPDAFTSSITVYTYEDGDIIEKRCEEPGWPNVTHDGCMMYENTYSTDKDKVVAWAKRSAAMAIKFTQEDIERREKELADCHSQLTAATANRAKLEADYPAVKQAG